MMTLRGCPACRTAVPPGHRICLSCGHDVAEPVRPCPACATPASAATRFCARCGHRLDVDAGDGRPAAATPATIPTGDVFREPRSYRVPTLIGAATLGAVLLALGVLHAVERAFFRPQSTIAAYFDALADRDATAAGRLADVTSDATRADLAVLDPAALRSPGYTPPDDVQIDFMEELQEDMARAHVTYALGDAHHTLSMTLRRAERATAGIYYRWRIEGGTYPISVRVTGFSSVMIAGVPVQFNKGSATAAVRAFPGRYVATLPDHPAVQAAPVTLTAGDDVLDSPRLVPAVVPAARDDIDRQVRGYLDRCAASTELRPEGCPFAAFPFAFGEVRNVRWRIAAYPAITLEMDPSQPGQMTVRTPERGRVDVSWQDAYGDQVDDETESVAFRVTGSVSVSGDRLTFQPTD